MAAIAPYVKRCWERPVIVAAFPPTQNPLVLRALVPCGEDGAVNRHLDFSPGPRLYPRQVLAAGVCDVGYALTTAQER